MIRASVKLWLTAAVTAAALVLLIRFALSPGDPAGILLYHRDGDTILLLLANDSDGTRGWGGFGGGAKRGESLRQTAARETEEETRGFFSRSWLEEQIAQQSPFSSRGFHLFFAQVPYVPGQRIMNHPVDDGRPELQETQFYAWIPFSEIEPLLVNEELSDDELQVNPRCVPEGCDAHTYWRVWIENMRDAQRQGAFPWSRAQ